MHNHSHDVQASLLIFLIFIMDSLGFIVFLAVIWVLQEETSVRILRYVILFIGICLSCCIFSFLLNELTSALFLISLVKRSVANVYSENYRCNEQFVFSLW